MTCVFGPAVRPVLVVSGVTAGSGALRLRRAAANRLLARRFARIRKDSHPGSFATATVVLRGLDSAYVAACGGRDRPRSPRSLRQEAIIAQTSSAVPTNSNATFAPEASATSLTSPVKRYVRPVLVSPGPASPG
jgi:hypothetical protein